MQERRYRPGDVLDDYCPRERRITDHAIVAMIDDDIRRTRCGVCDAEHEYKEAKVPAPRRKTQPPALFAQVLEGLNGPVPKPQSAPASPDDDPSEALDAPEVVEAPAALAAPEVLDAPAALAAPEAPDTPEAPAPPDDAESPALVEGGFRRSLIRATFPRPEGQAPAPRNIPEFTLQSLNNRGRNGQRQGGGGGKFRGGRRRAGGNPLDNIGPMRFRDHGHGQGQGQGGNTAPGHGGGGRRRRGGKKNR